MNNMECIVLFINNYEYQLHVPVYSYIVYNSINFKKGCLNSDSFTTSPYNPIEYFLCYPIGVYCVYITQEWYI